MLDAMDALLGGLPPRVPGIAQLEDEEQDNSTATPGSGAENAGRCVTRLTELRTGGRSA